MKLFDVVYGEIHTEYTGEYANAEEASKHFAPDIVFVDAPDWVFPGFGFDPSRSGDDRFIEPTTDTPGWVYDGHGTFWNPEQTRINERRDLHAATTNDTLQALRKIREGDTSIDWESWLKTLDDYNVAIEETKNQRDYPLKVIYPEYPKKPTK